MIELLNVALVVLGFVGWIYFWMTAINSGEKLLEPIFGGAAFPIACLGVPIAFVVLLSLFIMHGGGWVLLLLGAAFPLIGIWVIKTKRL